VTAQRPFVQWLVLHRGKADTPLGDFARDYASELPTTGDRAELRQRLEDMGSDCWTLSCFDVAWDQYEPPCSYKGCTKIAVAPSTLCPGHELGELL
jgi:uncharacterized protein YozE (UPF0346 family)